MQNSIPGADVAAGHVMARSSARNVADLEEGFTMAVAPWKKLSRIVVDAKLSDWFKHQCCHLETAVVPPSTNTRALGGCFPI